LEITLLGGKGDPEASIMRRPAYLDESRR
jgi:hypothetical protein